MNLTDRQREDLDILNVERERVRAWVGRMIDSCEQMKLPDKPLDMYRCVRLAESLDKALIQIYRPFPTPRAERKPRVPAPDMARAERLEPAPAPARPTASVVKPAPIHDSAPTVSLKTRLAESASASPVTPAPKAHATLPGLPRPSSPDLVKALNTRSKPPPLPPFTSPNLVEFGEV